MRALLGTVLGAIAVGVLLIAYALLNTGAASAAPMLTAAPAVITDSNGNVYQLVRPASQRIEFGQELSMPAPRYDGYGYAPEYVSMRTPVSYETPAPRVVRTNQAYQQPAAPRRTVSRQETRSGRDWKKTALIIGGSTAAGAGVGAIVGGKKGSLIGAAIGGGASSLWEAKH